MSDSHQVEVPPTFILLYSAPGGRRLLQPAAHVRERYELCEDLANMLTTQATARLHDLGVTEMDVLEKMEQGLAQEGSPVTPAEAWWVARRLAELLNWPMPAGDPPAAGD